MKTRPFVRAALLLTGLLILAGFLVKTQSQVRPPDVLTASERLSRGMFFGQRIVQVGPQAASEEESYVLLALLDNVAANNYRTGLAEVEEFRNAMTNSPWAPSLDAVLGRHYFEMGRYTSALEHWELAWEATKNYPAGNGKNVADYALASWTRLLASLGRLETLTNLVAECEGRVLDRGRLSQKWARTREAIGDMQIRPGAAYRCGTFALSAVARELGLKYDGAALINTPSPATGFSLATLLELSVRFGLGLFPVARTAGGELPVPSVVHWQQNHYAAIIARRGNLYKVVDPTFGHPRYMSAETINAEASGYFLAPANQVPANFRWLGQDETSLVYGRGNPNFLTDGDDQDCGSCPCPTGPGGSSDYSVGDDVANIVAGDNIGNGSVNSGADKNATHIYSMDSGCGSCSGMPVWRISEPYVNAWLKDEPIAYSPALGERMTLRLTYKQRSENEHRPELSLFSNLGHSWHCSWFSMVRLDPSGNVALNYANGGEALFLQSELEGQTGVGNYYNNLKFRAVTNGVGFCTGYELLHPDGAKEVYSLVTTNYGEYWHYLTQRISAAGHVTSFYYDVDNAGYQVRLHYVVDADGKTNTLYYHPGPYLTTLVTQISDPYGRSVYFEYDYPASLLTNIVDTAGISSTLAYDDYGWPATLTTPYGQTTFEYLDLGLTGSIPYAWYRQVAITQPNNGKQLYLFIQNIYEETRYGVPEYPASEVPTNTPIGTLNNTNLWARNTYHWGPLQYPTLSTTDTYYMTTNDFLRARMRHWLGDVPNHDYQNKMDTLSVERNYSPDGVVEGQKTWYDYPNKGPYGTGDQGTHILPGVIARVLPDGSTWYQWKRNNEWGAATNIVETYTQPDGTIGLRTNQYVHAANGLDLVLQIGPQGEQVVSNYFGNSYHQVDASYDVLNQETRYTYNGYRQLTSLKTPSGLTTTNIYFSSGASANRLDKTIDLEIARTNSYTYSGDLVYSHTDERGLTVTNYWDGLSRLTGRKYPDGTTTSNIYTALDITARKDRLGYWSYTGYNGIRQRLAETNANGVVTRYGLCECGAVMSVTNAWNTAAQMVTSFGYDLQGNRLYTYHPDATVTNWFDSLQRVIVTGDAWGYRWFGYNNQGRLNSISNAFGAEQFSVFDIDDRPIYVTDANSVTITNTYDVLGRLRTRTYPDAGVEKFGYSARGLVAYTNQLGYTNFYVYDEARRKVFETNANAEVIRYTNNAASDLIALVDGKNQVTKWKYDEYGRVTNKLDQAGTEILRYTYDANSRLASRWSVAKGTTYYTNDAVGNLTKVNYPASTDVTLQYDPLNRVTNMVDAAGTTIYSYAVGGQPYTEDGPWSSDTVTNTYDNRLRTALSLAQPTGKWTNGFAYDAARRLTNVTSPAGAFDYYLGATAAASPLIKKLALPNTSYITNAYDSVARLLFTKLNNSSHTTLDSALYGYNAGNQRTTFTNAAGTYVQYTNDPIGQLKIANSSVNSEDRGYTYDTAWNLNYRTNNGTLQTFKVDGLNQLTNAIGANYKYDANGNLTNAPGASTSYTYDDENRLTVVEQTYGFRSVFTYDGLGRLRQREDYTWFYSPYYNFLPSATVRYVYDGWRVIQERNESNIPTVSYTRGTDLSGSLEGAGGIGGLLARSHGYSSGTGNWSTHNHYHADGNGNITYLVNSSQTVAASYRYDPYGNTTASSGSLASANTYRFSSKEIHDASGLYYYGYRFYAPSLQRWVNRDPIEETGGLNLYAYAGNNSLNLIDPFGQQFAPTGPIWPRHHGSVDAKGTQMGPNNTGNAPVRNPDPPAPLRRCSRWGATQNTSPPYSVGECPCSGAVVTCVDWETCEYSQVAQGLNDPISALVWVKHTACSSCPEHLPGPG
jgi:RHS repeat-associated protein